MIEAFSFVEILRAVPMVFSLELFWAIYAKAEDDGDGASAQELKYELLHNLVMFVCTFFRFVDKVMNMNGDLVSTIELYGHIERFGSTLLYDNDSLHLKSMLRLKTKKLEYQLPKPLNTVEIAKVIMEHSVLSSIKSAKKEALRDKVRVYMYLYVFSS